MFHNTHSYIASKLYDSEDTYLLVGSILPDFAVMGTIPWERGLHGTEEREKFYKFVLEKYPDFINLAKGVIAHNILDDFTHLDYNGEPGYAFRNNEELIKLIQAYYGLEYDNARGKAHNFIETGVDILLLQENPDVQSILKKVVNDVNKDKISEILADYFKKQKAEITRSLTEFFDLFSKYDFSKEESWILFWKDLEKLLSLKDIGDEKREKLIKASLMVVASTYKDFLIFSVDTGKGQLISIN